MFLADLLSRTARYAEALAYAERVVRCDEQLYGQEHSETVYMKSVVANLRRRGVAG